MMADKTTLWAAQIYWQSRGWYNGKIDGIWGSKSAIAHGRHKSELEHSPGTSLPIPSVQTNRPVVATTYTPAVREQNTALWETIRITDAGRFAWAVAGCNRGKARYEAVGKKLNIPWWFIAITHCREASFNFTKHLHNGDPLTARTWRVPAGRPRTGSPPFTWEESAEDAMLQKGFEKITDWSIPHALWLQELYNGLGYRRYRGIFSPYIWAGTNHYSRGKYVADGKYDSTHADKQPGVAGILKQLGV